MPIPSPADFRNTTKTNAQMREMLADMAGDVESKIDSMKRVEGLFVKDLLPFGILNDSYVSQGTTSITKEASAVYKTFKFSIVPGKKYRIAVLGSHTRFRAAVVNSLNTNNVAIPYNRLLANNDALSEFEFTNTLGQELYVYTGTNTEDVVCQVSEYPYKLKHPIIAQGLDTPIGENDISNRSITAEKTDFVEQFLSTKNVKLSRTITINHAEDDNRTYLANSSDSNAWTYIAPLNPNESVSIELSAGSNNRFRVVVMNREVITASGQNVDRVITLDNNLRSVSFENDGAGKFLFITVNTGTNTQITVIPTVKSIHTKIIGLNVPKSEFEYKPNFKLVIGKIEDSTVNTLNSEAQYPRLSNIKYEYKPDTHPIPVGYLYTSNQAPYKFLYSSGKPDNMKELCTWDESKTWGGNKNPSQYSQFITDDGNIVCVTRGDQIAGSNLNADARQNPIIYPAGDYDNPIVVDFGERIKPTAWARCNGITSVPGEDFFIFSEYTRPTHDKAYIWKVSKPYTNPDNWERVFELTIDRPGSNHPEGQFKHFHATDYDPFSGAIIATTGDYGENGPHFYMSLDKGDTWVHQAGGDEKHYRLSQFVFDKEYVYWGSDTAIPNGHLFIKAPRDLNGFPMLHKDHHEIVHTFPNDSGSAATYNTIYLRSPHGLLFADRQDSTTTTIPLKIWFYSFDTKTMHEVAIIEKLEGLNEARGFRCDCIATYQPLNDDRIVCGFNAASARNAMKIAGNSATNRVNNLTLTVVRSD